MTLGVMPFVSAALTMSGFGLVYITQMAVQTCQFFDKPFQLYLPSYGLAIN